MALKTLSRPVNLIGSAGAVIGRVGSPHTASTLDLSKYLLSQCTIVCSVIPEIIHPRRGPDYNIIDESCNHLVNQNGDSWLNQVIIESYPSFRGAFNFVEHLQILSENKGRILDAVARKVFLTKPDPDQVKEEGTNITNNFAPSFESLLTQLRPTVPTPRPAKPQKLHTNQMQYIIGPDGQPKFVWYIDILVATALQYTSLIEQILDGDFNAMSMGCVVTGSSCSYCGHVIREPNPAFCQCLLNDRGTLRQHPDAKRLVAVSELCGIPGEPETNQFIEASWVKDPAFIGARKAYIIDIPDSLRKAYSIPEAPELKNLPKAASLKAASAMDHSAYVVDNQTLRNTAQAFSHNNILRTQLNRYLNLYGYTIEPIPGRSTYPNQTNNPNEFDKVQKMFKSIGLK